MNEIIGNETLNSTRFVLIRSAICCGATGVLKCTPFLWVKVMETLNKKQILKRINGNVDAASEFILLNQEVGIEDREWMLQEANRVFRLHRVGLKALDINFGSELKWQVEIAA